VSSDYPFPTCEPINLTDPTVPALAAWFTLQSIPTLTYAARSQSYDVISRRAPVIISQVRSSPNGSLVLLIKTASERRRLLDLVSSGRVLLLRNPDPAYPETSWYISVGQVSEERIIPDHRRPERRMTLEFVVVDRPGGLIASSKPTTWEDVVNTYTAWGTALNPNSLQANADTWIDVLAKKPQVKGPVGLRGVAPATNSNGAYGVSGVVPVGAD
jgi:hypothetical protein